jgi:hypothetical protein
MLFSFFSAVNVISFNNSTLAPLLFKKVENLNKLLTKFYLTNENLWLEGLYVDFLQKKFIDNWIKKFLIGASYLFSEKLVFEALIKFFINQIITPFHKFSIFEFNSLANLLFITIFILLLFYILYFCVHLLILIF